jgi:diguanylate cyclase (GGDEF)-like protein
MAEKLFKSLCQSIKELHQQEESVHTLHQILFSLKGALGVSAAALVQKNPQSGYLEIKSRYNLSAHYTNSYKRANGKAAVDKIFLTDNFLIVKKTDSAEVYEDVRMETDYAVAVLIRLESEDRPLGFIVVFFDEEIEITEQIRDFLIAIADICSESIRRERLMLHLNELRRVEPKSGLLYYHYFYQKLIEEYSKSKRTKTPLTVCIIDMDNFKEVMSVYGPDIADELYQELGDELKSSLRGIDILGRYGTDEIIIYMPNTSLENAEIVINRFVEKISSSRFTIKQLKTTVSIGVAQLKENEKLEGLLSNAKGALYNARVTGKGIVKSVD